MEELDQLTIKRAIRGDKRAFHLLYDHYSPYIWRLHYRVLSGNYEDARELLQETFVKIHSSLKDFRFEAMFSTWAYRIAYNIAIAFLARRKKFSGVSYEDTITGKARSDIYDNREIIGKILEKVSPEDRFLLIAKEIDGFSYDDLAQIMNLSAGALRTRLHRLKEEIREKSAKFFIKGCTYAG